MKYNQVLEIIKSKFGFISILSGLRYATLSTKQLWSQYIYNILNLYLLDKELVFRLKQTCNVEYPNK